MKENKLKNKIGIIYLLLSVVTILFSITNKIFLYIGFSILGISLRAFYFAYINMDKEVKQEDEKKCYGSYYFYYPLMLAALLSLSYLLFFEKFVSPRIEEVLVDPIIALICLYLGFDIYRIAGNKI